MKNTIKKAICTALAAVSLSAMVTVPSSLNAPKSDNAIVNVMEADAAGGQYWVEGAKYEVYVTKGDKYYIRSSPKFGNNIYPDERLYTGTKYPVYEEKSDAKGNKWLRISRNDEKREKWIYKNRTHKVRENHNNCKTYEKNQNSAVETINGHKYLVIYHNYHCTSCDGYRYSERYLIPLF
ncbi:hypothetical protein [Ruminococcus sp.]|uniref:hypothetical protein n=1 Tax=Ruminococcus sp. TaxID=41978 RepID=UPI0025F0F71B|nr:hypothetical protein [Ruminococcus sp.]MCR4639071.1 hypothetical protein [Ruminococcus sp.]